MIKKLLFLKEEQGLSRLGPGELKGPRWLEDIRRQKKISLRYSMPEFSGAGFALIYYAMVCSKSLQHFFDLIMQRPSERKKNNSEMDAAQMPREVPLSPRGNSTELK